MNEINNGDQFSEIGLLKVFNVTGPRRLLYHIRESLRQ